MIDPKELSARLCSRAEEKFDFDDDDTVCLGFLELRPESLVAAGAMVARIKHKGTTNGKRTILMSSMEVLADLAPILKWTGEVRDHLPGTESADLYLLLVGPGLDENEAIRVESDELFCRKYVSRFGEALDEFLDRCFFGNPLASNSLSLVSDPLASALRKTGVEFPEFTAIPQRFWREALLSIPSGTDLVMKLSEVSFDGEQQ